MAPIDPHSYTDSTHPLTTHISLNFYFDFPSSTITPLRPLLRRNHPRHALALHLRRNRPRHRRRAPLHARFVSRRRIGAIPNCNPLKSRPISGPLQNGAVVLRAAVALPAADVQQILPLRLHPVPGHPRALDLPLPGHAGSADQIRREIERPALPLRRDGREARGPPRPRRRGVRPPIPPYLFGFAVAELRFREVGPRTKVYSEVVPAVLDAAAREFAGAEEMIKVGEALFGPYEWERFDLLVLPPSFPYGGMENPRMTVLTPTVIMGDATGAQVVAHELAHSWTGNLITNKNNDHFWLNEV